MSTNVSDGVRCQNPRCRAKLAESLQGTLIVTCRKCGTKQAIIQGASPFGGSVSVTMHKGAHPGSNAERF